MAHASSNRAMEQNPALLALLAAAAAGRLHHVATCGGEKPYDALDLSDGSNLTGWQRVDREVAVMHGAKWLGDWPVARADGRARLWLPSGLGWRILKRRGLNAAPAAPTTPTGRLRALPTSHPQAWNVAYRAAVFCESAARVARTRELLWKACSPDGVRRACGRCVYCLLGEVRGHDYGWAGLGVCEADRAESLVAAFEAVEAHRLHTAPPVDAGEIADLLMYAASDLAGSTEGRRAA